MTKSLGHKRAWKEKVGYSGVHKWIVRKFGPANKCEECGNEKAKRYEWANIDGVIERDRKHYAMLCKSCHNKMDRWGHKLKIKK